MPIQRIWWTTLHDEDWAASGMRPKTSQIHRGETRSRSKSTRNVFYYLFCLRAKPAKYPWSVIISSQKSDDNSICSREVFGYKKVGRTPKCWENARKQSFEGKKRFPANQKAMTGEKRKGGKSSHFKIQQKKEFLGQLWHQSSFYGLNQCFI